ncbi:MAG: hypothetical protein WC869_14210 [Phycisphaerae bacterium]|jgi:hypothetical protein
MVKITLHQRERLLQIASLSLAGGTVLVAVLSLAWPLAGTGPLQTRAAGKTGPATQRASSPLPFTSYDAICRVDLTKPLFDPPPPKAPAVPDVPPPKLNMRLTGTANEPGYVCAFFITPQGAIKVVRVGETIEGAEVIAITAGSVRLRQGGQEVTMTLAAQEGQ